MTAPSWASLMEAGYPLGHPIWAYNAKLDSRALAESLGVRVPELLAGPCPRPHDLELPPGAAAVVKPNGGCFARGVLPLVGLRHVVTGEERTWLQWCDCLAAHERLPMHRVRPPWFAEAMVGGGPELPCDWKCWTIGGRVHLVMQVVRGVQRRLKWWSRDFESLGEIRTGAQHSPLQLDPSLPAPTHGAELIEAAERIQRALPAPTARIDLYEDAAGPVFGEVSPRPGRDRPFTAEWDRRLGVALQETIDR